MALPGAKKYTSDQITITVASTAPEQVSAAVDWPQSISYGQELPDKFGRELAIIL